MEKSSILLITPYPEDETMVRQVMKDVAGSVVGCNCISTALEKISANTPDVILCETEFVDGDWKKILSTCESLSSPPLVLVMSRYADESLWAEVLNLGGFDVLLKPFDPTEVSRVLGMACSRRSDSGVRMPPESATVESATKAAPLLPRYA